MSRERNNAWPWESILDRRRESDELGAARITGHPILGDLPPVPLVEFTFDGAAVVGSRGEPIAAALFAAGYRVLRTMPRFGDAAGRLLHDRTLHRLHGRRQRPPERAGLPDARLRGSGRAHPARARRERMVGGRGARHMTPSIVVVGAGPAGLAAATEAATAGASVTRAR